MDPQTAIEAVTDLAAIAGALPARTVVIPGGDRHDDLRLVESARDHGIVERCVLVGQEASIRAAAEAVGVEVPADCILDASGQEAIARRTVDLADAGGAEIILKGNISTPVLNREVLRIRTRDTVSLVTAFDAAPLAGGRPMLLTDPGVTTTCDERRLTGLIRNAVDVARHILGRPRPRVALLSANEKIIESLPSTTMARRLSAMDWPDGTVYGPLSLDLAVSDDSVRLKVGSLGPAAEEVAGRADVLVCPSLDAANILYKIIMEMVKYGIATFAGLTVGVKVPYVILSRADSVETKLLSIALGSLACERMPAAEAEGSRS